VHQALKRDKRKRQLKKEGGQKEALNKVSTGGKCVLRVAGNQKIAASKELRFLCLIEGRPCGDFVTEKEKKRYSNIPRTKPD